jgi:hypothetical protein
MMLAVWVVECFGAETTGWDFLHDVSGFLKELPQLGGRGGTPRETAAAAHYRNGLACEGEGVALGPVAPHGAACEVSKGHGEKKQA